MSSILVVDYLPVFRAYTRHLLESAGYEVQEAANGVEALETLLRQPTHALFMDVHLPLLNGLAMIRCLRKNSATRALPILCTTVAARPGEREAVLRAGANLFREKPLPPGMILGLARLLTQASHGMSPCP